MEFFVAGGIAEAGPSPSLVVPITDPHITIEPSTLYLGTPVVLISTQNEDGTANLGLIPVACGGSIAR